MDTQTRVTLLGAAVSVLTAVEVLLRQEGRPGYPDTAHAQGLLMAAAIELVRAVYPPGTILDSGQIPPKETDFRLP